MSATRVKVTVLTVISKIIRLEQVRGSANTRAPVGAALNYMVIIRREIVLTNVQQAPSEIHTLTYVLKSVTYRLVTMDKL